jgi:S-adenosylmethionine:tRNA ribosyltransferase-isomerase
VDLAEFDYPLPRACIAQRPLPSRDASRLLLIDRGQRRLSDHRFTELPGLLRPGDCLVVNDSRVIPARVFAREPRSGAPVELLFIDAWSSGSPGGAPSTGSGQRWRALARPGRRCRPGGELIAGGGQSARLGVVGVEGDGVRIIERLDGGTIADLLDAQGLPPLPPYLDRHAKPEREDWERYQTVYARHPGAVAAPTAGLHFTTPLLQGLRARGIEVHALTLHVGPATFRPIRSQRIEEHRLPPERVSVPAEVADAVNAARAERRRVVAVGTTTTRALEGSATRNGWLEPGRDAVDLYISPGYAFRIVDALITNFHLPGSSLLVLVSAFAGRELILEAYRHAVTAGYRFYSYGDATLIE